MKVAIIGFGSFGKAVYHCLDQKVIEKIGIISSKSQLSDHLKKTDLINYKDLSTYDFIFLTLPAASLLDVLDKISTTTFKGIILNTAKGITDRGLFSSVIQSRNDYKYAYISGAGFAEDILSGSNFALCFSSMDKALYEKTTTIFNKKKVIWSFYNNPEAAELLSALKNVYSIYLGYHSVKSASITENITKMTNCFKEMHKVITELQFGRDIMFNTAGFGDLVLSGSSPKSRNFSFGKSIAESRIENDINLIEGINTIRFITRIIPENILCELNILNDTFALLQPSPIVNEKSRGHKRVLTYGTFDLFHYGHIEILRRAKNRGDYLIVGLSTDEFNRIKGKQSVQSYEQRKKNLEALNLVDLIIPENDWSQKKSDVLKHKIDLFVIGADWSGKFDFLKKYCNVEYLSRTEGISTTLLKKSLNLI